MDVLLIILAFILLFIGVVGSILPIIPGPPLAYLGMVVLHISSKAHFSVEMLLIYGILTVLVTVLDYLVPIYGTKKMGGTKYGMWGTSIGLIVGIFFFPPLGLIIGPFVGAFIGEVIYGKKSSVAFLAALGAFLGFLFGTLLKLIVSVMIFYHAIVYLIK